MSRILNAKYKNKSLDKVPAQTLINYKQNVVGESSVKYKSDVQGWGINASLSEPRADM